MPIRSLIKRTAAQLDHLLESRARQSVPGAEEGNAVFIVGGPRSGSTLLYQVLLHSRRFAYINNVVALFPRSAPVAARLLGVGHWPTPKGFSSDYGDTRGPSGPSEAGDLWDEIFPWSTHHSLDAQEISEETSLKLRRLVVGLSKVYDAPFLCKNLWHSVRIEAIAHALPQANFIVCERDPLQLADSMLTGRAKALGDRPGLWSIRPREVLGLEDAPPREQIAAQIVHTYSAIERARERVANDRFFTVPYEAFCREPDAWVDQIDSFITSRGFSLQPGRPTGRTFQVRSDLSLSDSDASWLAQELRARMPSSFSAGDSCTE